MSKLLDLVTYVQDTIMQNRFALWVQDGDWFTKHPSACCDKASEILKRFLEANNTTDYFFIRKEGSIDWISYSHVWIESNKLSIDITAHQFNDWRYGVFFDYIIICKTEDYFFNKQNGEYFKYDPFIFETPCIGYFDYEKFYQTFFRKIKVQS